MNIKNLGLGGLQSWDNESGGHGNLESFSSLQVSSTRYGGSSSLSRKKQSLSEPGNTAKIKDIIKDHRP
jgi:hypothetical protein